MRTESIIETMKYWEHIFPYAHTPHNTDEYEKLLNLANNLIELSRKKNDEKITSFLTIVAKNIEEYELNNYPTYTATPIETLKFLMEPHGLEQGDLPEIGSQSLVSKILNGERNLTVIHIKRLAARFNVSPAVFI